MPLTCVSNDAILKKPAGLDYSTPSASPPFTLNGAPFANNPESLTGKQETVSYTISGSPGQAATATSPAVGATADRIGYRTVDINTANIIGENSATTLKYENKTYRQKFIALHQGIWGDSRPYVSILLLSPENDFFHFCIPINLIDSDQDTNLFLKHWLHGGALPSGFTLNQILHFRGPSANDVKFGIVQYCLKYNAGANINPYTLCVFQTPLNLKKTNLWVPSFSGISKPTFDNVMNYMLNGMFRNNDSRIVSVEKHFNDSVDTTPTPTPSHYMVKSSALIGKSFELFASSNTPGKKLNNIKCYPIDLFNQIDDDGNIFIDESSKKPVDIKSVNDPNADIAKNSLAELERQKSLNNLSFIVVFSILFGVICLIIIVLAVWFFSGKPASSAAGGAGAIGTNALNAAQAAAIAAAVNASLQPERDALDQKRQSKIQTETDARLKQAAQQLATEAKTALTTAETAAAGTEKFAATRSWGDFFTLKPKTDPLAPASPETTRLRGEYEREQGEAIAAKAAYNQSVAANLARARQPASDAAEAVRAAREKATAAKKLVSGFPNPVRGLLGARASPTVSTAARDAIIAARAPAPAPAPSPPGP